jgi:hypothetical protein
VRHAGVSIGTLTYGPCLPLTLSLSPARCAGERGWIRCG